MIQREQKKKPFADDFADDFATLNVSPGIICAER